MDQRKGLAHGSVLRLGGTDYRIEAELGRGSNAIVYTGVYEDRLMPDCLHRVLIKELFPYDKNGGIWRDSTGCIVCNASAADLFRLHLESFERGNRVQLHLQEQYPDRGNTNFNSYDAYGSRYSVLEYQGGQTMEAYLAATPCRTLTQAAALTLHLTHALKPFHALSMLHLDISPDNLLLLPLSDGQPEAARQAILFDYNSSWNLEELTGHTGVYCSAKEPYAAPEVSLHSHAELGSATDLYAVCVVFAQMLCGRRLQMEELSGSRLGGVFRDAPLLLDVPKTVRYQALAIVKRGLRLSPSQRYQTIAALEADLRELQARILGVGITHSALFEASARAYHGQLPTKKDDQPRLPCEIELEEERFSSLQPLLACVFPTQARHVQLTGEGGSGKTTALVRLWGSLLETYAPSQPIPVYLPLYCADGQADYIQRTLLARLQFDEHTPTWKLANQRLLSVLSQPLQAGAVPAVVLLLDGWNELPAGDAALKRELAALMQLPGLQLIVTDRAGACPLQLRRAVLVPPDDSRMDAYLTACGRAIPRGPERALLKNPMLLSLYAHGGCTAGADRRALIQSYLDHLLCTRAAARLLDRDVQAEYAVSVFLPALAALMVRGKRRYLTTRQLYAWVCRSYAYVNSRTFLRHHPRYTGKTAVLLGGCTDAECWFEQLVTELLVRDLHLLRCDSEGRYRFAHDLFLEALAQEGVKPLRQAELRRCHQVAALALAVLAVGALVIFVASGGVKTQFSRASDLPFPATEEESALANRIVLAVGQATTSTEFRLNLQQQLLSLVTDEALRGDSSACQNFQDETARLLSTAMLLETIPEADMELLMDDLNAYTRSAPAEPTDCKVLHTLLTDALQYEPDTDENIQTLLSYLTPDGAGTLAQRQEAVELYAAMLDMKAKKTYLQIRISLAGFECPEKREYYEDVLGACPILGGLLLDPELNALDPDAALKALETQGSETRRALVKDYFKYKGE